MESALSATTTTTKLLAMSKTLKNSSSNPSISRLLPPIYCLRNPLVSLQLRVRFNYGSQRSKAPNSISYSSNSLRSLCAVTVPPVASRLECAASLASAAGGGGASDGGEAKSNSVLGGAEEVSALPPDAIILDVRGMMCEGCTASVKRILESQPQVSSASVNLATETAIIWPVPEAKVIPNWQKHVGEILAKHLTSCGFKSDIQGQGAIEGDIPS